MTNAQRWTYIRHIKRLQTENKILRSIVAEERLRRQAAFGWYIKRLNSKLAWMVDAMLYLMRNPR